MFSLLLCDLLLGGGGVRGGRMQGEQEGDGVMDGGQGLWCDSTQIYWSRLAWQMATPPQSMPMPLMWRELSVPTRVSCSTGDSNAHPQPGNLGRD